MKRKGIMLWAVGLFFFYQAAEADWTPAKRLSWNTGWSEYPAIAVDPSGNPHVVWDDDVAGNPVIFYKKSTDGGATWAPAKTLSFASLGCYRPRIIVDSSGAIHVVWYDFTPGDYEVYYKKSTDGGVTWMKTKRITWTPDGSEYPVVAVDPSGNPHVAWMEYISENYEIYYKKSTNGGITWGPAKRLTWNSGGSNEPSLAVDSSGSPHVVWFDRTPGNDEIYYKKSTNGGTTWGAAKRLTWDSYGSWYPAIAADTKGALHVVWENATSETPEIYYKKSTDEGAAWTKSQRLTWNAGLSGSPHIAVDPSDNPHVVWYDSTPGPYEVYYKMSTDEGATWAATRRLTYASATSTDPDIAAGPSGNLHVVWCSNASGNLEIYYKKGK